MDRESQRLAFAAGGSEKVVRDFFGLSRQAQDRFIAATRGLAPPSPILRQRAPRTAIYAWLVASLVFPPVAFALSRAGFGDVASPLAVQPTSFVAVYAALFAASVYAVVHALSLWSAERRLPFVAGTYVFPACVIDARTHRLKVYAMAEVIAVERTAAGVAVSMGGARLEFTADGDAAERAMADIHAAQIAMKEGPTSVRAWVLLDPLFDGALASPLGPNAPMARRVPAWSTLGWAAALVIGGALGLTMVLLRNASSDRAMFATAATADDVTAYQAYVARGGERSLEVSEVLLPRAELREAEKLATVEAIRAFVASHPGFKILPEAGVAFHKAMARELDKAKREGTVTGLDAFAARYPDHGLPTELAAARHALYALALDAYTKVAPGKDGAAEKAMAAVLAFAEKHGPRAEVRFAVRTSKSMATADLRAEKSKFFGGPEAYPSRHFDEAHLAPYALPIQTDLVQRLNALFPADLLAFQASDAHGDIDPAAVKVPTLELAYTTEWSKTFAMSDKPKAIFVGVTLEVDGALYVPGEARPYQFRFTGWRGPQPWRFRKQLPKAAVGELEEKVYEAMRAPVFDTFHTKVLGALFAPDKAPEKG